MDTDTKITEISQKVEILIVGFGYSSIPLLRELEKRGQEYAIVSCGNSIWQQLKAKDKLDFDLVTSFHTSVLSQDQVQQRTLHEFFPTATWFYEYHEKIFEEFKDKVTDAKVTLVENFHDKSFSLVHTDDGNIYKAQNVVFATGFGRPQNKLIQDLDLDVIKNKTIVINMSGDTANMILAKAVPNGNKCIILSNGYIVLDKFVGFDSPGPKGSHWFLPTTGIRTGKQYRIDLAQMESHTLGDLFPTFYKYFINNAWGPPGPDSWLGRRMWPNAFFVRFPETYRRDIVERNERGKAGIPNGLLAIKYNAIDMYKLLYGDDLEKHISEGYLLNDICFWHTEGLAETWKKRETSVDHKNKTLRGPNGRIVPFDLFIDGGAEQPNLPTIVSINQNAVRHEFSYRYRDNFLGVVPRHLKNVFFMGFTRPTSGGIANIVEMQALMVHKLLSNPTMKAELYSEIGDHIRKYNEYYYVEKDKDLPTDHLVFFGLYTREVARYLGLHRPILRSAFSLNPVKFIKNLRFEILFANNSIKYRMEGEYKVEGADKLARDIFAYNEHNSLPFLYQLCLLWDRTLGYQCAAMLAWKYSLQPLVELGTACDWKFDVNKCGWSDLLETILIPGITAVIVLCIALVVMGKKFMLIVLQTYNLPPPMFGFKATFQPLVMLYTARFGEWPWCFAIFGFFCLVAFMGRQFHAPGVSSRYLFGDCKYKELYRPFWGEYKKTFAKVYETKQQQKKDI